MSDEQVRATVAAMRMREHEKQIIVRRALANDPSARFVVFAHFIKAGQ